MRVSLGYTNQSGIIKTNSYKRYTFDGGISPKFLKDHLSLNVNLKASMEDNVRVDESVVGNALSYDPTRPVRTGSATASTDPGLGYFIWMNGNSPMAIQTNNPVAQLNLQDMNNKLYRSIGNLSVNYKVHGFEDLQFNMNMGYDVLESKYSKDGVRSDVSGDITADQLNLDFILDERQREFASELIRRTDLIRFGKFTSGRNWDWKNGVREGSDVADHLKLFPIPATEFSNMPNLIQNNGYVKK